MWLANGRHKNSVSLIEDCWKALAATLANQNFCSRYLPWCRCNESAFEIVESPTNRGIHFNTVPWLVDKF